jgi:uncharacterized repeat protein (TIGR04138 family)
MTASDGIEQRIEALRRRDRRYAREAYEFLLEALDHTLVNLGKDRLTGEERHIGGRELLMGIRDVAAQLFGPMAPVVFRRWGVRRTADFGEIVFNLVDIGLLSRRADDSRLDFADGFDFDLAFDEAFRDRLESISSAG